MNTVDEIKVAALKREVAVGVEDFVHGRFQTYTDTNIMQLADDVGRNGRTRLKVAAEVQGKKK